MDEPTVNQSISQQPVQAATPVPPPANPLVTSRSVPSEVPPPSSVTPTPMGDGMPQPNAGASKKSLYLILTIIALVVIFALLSFFLFSQRSQMLATQINLPKQNLKTTPSPQPSITEPQASPESQLNSLDLGNPDTDLQSIQQNVDQL